MTFEVWKCESEKDKNRGKGVELTNDEQGKNMSMKRDYQGILSRMSKESSDYSYCLIFLGIVNPFQDKSGVLRSILYLAFWRKVRIIDNDKVILLE